MATADSEAQGEVIIAHAKGLLEGHHYAAWVADRNPIATSSRLEAFGRLLPTTRLDYTGNGTRPGQASYQEVRTCDERRDRQ